MKYVILAASHLALFAINAIHAAYAEESGKISLETGMDYNTGKYGGTQTTHILYVPVTGKYQGKSWTLKLTVPYLRISGPTNVINGVGGTGTAATTVNTRSGLGDVIASATHNIYNGGPTGLMVNLSGKVKLGTASSTQGLGTGKNDYSLQTEIFQMSGNLTRFGTLGYKVYGQPAGYTLNNNLYGSLGGSYKFNQETNGGAMLNLSAKHTQTGSSHIEAIFFASRKLQKDWKAQAYFLKGFTNSVPSWGTGATIALLF